MLERLIRGSVKHHAVVMILALVVLAAGVQAVRTTPLDAIPDLSDVQVIIFTEYPGQSPQVVEDQVTYPLTTTMLSVPGASVVRGYSFFGLSFVYVVFKDGTDMYWARSRVLEYLNYAQSRLPPGVTPALGPDATGVGWVYEYVLASDRHDLAQLRSIQDWQIRYALQQVDGVAEVASVGGFVRQYQVTVDPHRLQSFGLTLASVRRAIERGNRDTGGRVIEHAEHEYMVRGLGYIKSLDDLRDIVLKIDPSHIPVRIADVASVAVGPEMRRGLAELDGEGEVVGGIVVMRYGQNAAAVIARVKTKLAALASTLPEGVRVVPVYDRSSLIERAVATLKEKIVEECAVVALVCIVFLLHARSALVAIFTLPAGILFAFLIMRLQGVNADIMSLGGIAIAIGAMVDAAIVMVENMHKHVERAEPDADRWKLAVEAAVEVGPALFFALLIIAVSFLPVFALQAQEGRLFKPLAYTKTYAMVGAALASVTVVPILMGLWIRGRIRPEHDNPVNRALRFVYRPVLTPLLRHPIITAAVALALLAGTLWPLRKLGSEFMPPLDEGDILYMPSMLPGISVTKARQVLQETDRIIRAFPEVDRVFGKIGRAETATDPAPLGMIETIVTLKPHTEWRDGMTKDKLVAELDRAIRMPGVTNAWTMPIKTRIDMLATGIKTPVGIKVMGPSLDKLAGIAERIEARLRQVPGTASVYAERVTGGYFLDVAIDRAAIGRYGIQIDDVQMVLASAVGGMNVGYTVEGLERYPINVRYPRELRTSLEALGAVLVDSPMGHQVPLAQLADLRYTMGPPMVKSEGARPNAWIYVDVTGSDIGGYVARAKEAVQGAVQLEPGYSVVWSGQYEYMERAGKRLQLIVPLTVLLVFFLLFMGLGSLTDALLVMLVLPFALTGGVWLLWLLHYDLSVAVGVGFLALAGVAAETGVVMIVYLRQALDELTAKDPAPSVAAIHQAVLHGAAERLRPKSMTVAAIILGLLPIMWSAGTGASVMKRVAAPMIGGMVSSTLLTLLLLPVLYGVIARRRIARGAAPDEAEPPAPIEEPVSP